MNNRAIIAALVWSALAANAAQGAIVDGTITGIIDGNTFDTYGLFGTAGGNLSHQVLTASYAYDTTMDAYVRQPEWDAWIGSGGLSLSVTVDGVTRELADGTEAEVIDTRDGGNTEWTLATFAPTPLIAFTLLATGAWVPGVTIDAPFALDTTWYQQTIYVSADGSHYDTLNFAGSSAPGVPVSEPATVTLLAGAFFGLGRRAVSRRRLA